MEIGGNNVENYGNTVENDSNHEVKSQHMYTHFFFISITDFWTEGPKIHDAYKKSGEKSGYTEGKSLSIMMLIKK